MFIYRAMFGCGLKKHVARATLVNTLSAYFTTRDKYVHTPTQNILLLFTKLPPLKPHEGLSSLFIYLLAKTI